MYRKTVLTFVATMLLAVFGTAALGQTTGGAVTGQVLDIQSAAVQNASVTLQSETTGQNLTTQTTGAGTFSFPNVPVGEYKITIESQGFQPTSQKVKVALNQESNVNVTLQPGNVSGSVQISAGSEALVQTESSQTGGNFETRQIQDLPIFNDARSLALLSPNVVAQAAGVSGDGGSVGGTRPRSNTFNVDGVDNNSPDLTGQQVNVIQDAISEVSILTNNYNAEFGTGAGGQFNSITKTGSNEFHGSGFVYIQNQKLNAASTGEERLLNLPLSDPARLSGKPKFRDTRYGLTVGGPIVKNKLFFFFAGQNDIIGLEGAGTSFQAPTAVGLAQIAGLPGASPFVVNLLANNLVLPTTPTFFDTVLGTENIPFGEVTIVTPGGSRQPQHQINIDYLRGSKDQIRGRWTFDRIRQEQPGNGNPKFNNLLAQDSRLFSLAWIRTISPSLVNELRLSYKRFIQDFPLKDPAFNDFPNLTVNSLSLLLGPNGNLPQGGFNNAYQIYDAASYTHGAHSFKFGGELRYLIFTSFFLPRGRGDYVYTTLDVLLRDNPPDNLDLRGVGSSAFTGNQKKYYAFVQDDWRVTPNLTLNLGARYEYLTLPRDAALNALNSISSVPGVIEFGVPKTDKNNIAPRVGFAYAPEFNSRLGRMFSGTRGQSSIRGSFALSYYETFQNLFLLQLPPQFQQENDGASAGITNRFLERGGVPPIPIPPNTPAAARSATGSFIRDVVQPYNMAWTLSYQRELTPGTALELRYLHTAGRHLPVQVRLNGGVIDYSKLVVPTFLSNPTAAQLAGLPTLGSLGLDLDPVDGAFNNRFPRRLGSFGFAGNVTSFEPEGNSVYDGASASLTRRFSKSLAFTAAYTWSKAIDNATNELFSSTVNPRRAQDIFDLRQERSLSAIDVPHRFAGSFNYDFPKFNHRSGFVKSVLGGWQLNGVFQAQSGQIITPQSSIDSNRDRDAAGDRTIVNLNGVPGTGSGVFAVNALGQRIVGADGADLLGDASTVAYVAINPNAQYIQAGYGARANAGRNTLRTNGFNRTDMVLVKNFYFGEERYNVQFGAEVFNVFNQRLFTIGDFGSPNFSAQNFDPTAGIGASASFSFPNVSGENFNDYSIGNFSGRTVQLRVKFIF